MKSWKTTLVGVVGGLGILLSQVYFAIDGNDATIFSWEQVLAGLGLLGIGWFSRDNDKTSEDVKARR
jgi:hypothetical protein